MDRKTDGIVYTEPNLKDFGYEDSQSDIPTEPQIRTVTKEDFEQGIAYLVDACVTMAACLGEAAYILEGKDAELKKLCLEGQKMLDKITTHVIDRSL